MFDDLPSYLVDVIEQMGDDLARRCWWDWGPWSDLARRYRPLDGPPAGGAAFKVLNYASSCCP